MSYNSTIYNEDYYRSHCGDCYERGNGWEEIFAGQSERIVKELAPKSVLDVGCASGYLVEGLRDRGVEAWGIDISEYAISRVREDIRPFCKVASATEKFEKKYDLITCIEVVEHLDPNQYSKAIENMCNATDVVLFSSTPFDYNEESHFSVNSTGFWCRLFAYNGFFHDIDYDASYIAAQTMLFRKKEKSIPELVANYEDKFFSLWNENVSLRYKVNLSEARINDLDRGNIEHAEKLEILNEQIVSLKDQIEQDEKKWKIQRKELMQKYEDEMKKMTEKHISTFREEYEKRDEMEVKFAIVKRHQEFLESELWKAQHTRGYGKEQIFEGDTDMQTELRYVKLSLENMENSLSWKLTKPLRVIDGLIRRNGRNEK